MNINDFKSLDKTLYRQGYCHEYAMAVAMTLDKFNIEYQYVLIGIEYDSHGDEEKELEVAHVAIQVHDDIIDANGVQKIDDIINDCMFFHNGEVKIIHTNDNAYIESFLGGICDEAVEMALQDIENMLKQPHKKTSISHQNFNVDF